MIEPDIFGFEIFNFRVFWDKLFEWYDPKVVVKSRTWRVVSSILAWSSEFFCAFG